MRPNRIRTLLIDDSAFMRKVIGNIISSDNEIELIATAADGKEGRDLTLELHPDVVVTDMVMPEYDGMYVVDSLMKQYPVPIILLSSLEKTNTLIFDALQRGAFEFIDKHTVLDKATLKDYSLLSLIKEASRADATLLKNRQLAKEAEQPYNGDAKWNYEVIAIGSSTGGPGAVESIITRLPETFITPIVIAQHMPARFLESFAERLNEHSTRHVKLATKGETLKKGVIYIVPGNTNVKIERSIVNGMPMISFTSRKYSEFNNPSINCLFESVARTFGNKSVGIILTGMGKDGVDGLKAIKQQGGFTIAQDENSSVVYGMPKAAVESGAVKKILSLRDIPRFIVSHYEK